MIKLGKVWVEKKVRRQKEETDAMPSILSFFLFQSENREVCQATLALSPVSD